MIKLIASDLDGTLLDNNGNIPKEFGSIIEELNLKNIKFAIASGRNYRETVHRFEKYRIHIISEMQKEREQKGRTWSEDIYY